MDRFRRQIISWAKVLASQAAVLALLWTISDLIPSAGHRLIIPLLLFQGLLAAAIGKLLGLSAFWLPIQMFIPLALVYGDAVPAWVYLLAFVVIALVFWNSPTERVPLFLTNQLTRTALSKLIISNRAHSLVDLGCGTGGVVVELARQHRELFATGVETAPPIFAIAWLNALLRGRGRARIAYQSFWKSDLSTYDLVYCFLSPAPMARLYTKAKSEMRPGALLVSNSFAVPGLQPDQIIEVGDGRQTRLYVYRIRQSEPL